MRAMLPLIRDQVIVHDEKVIVWTQFPAEQVYIATTLREANIDARVFHAALTRNERTALIETFTQNPKECMVLLCSYKVNVAGLNLQRLCRNVHLFSMGFSNSVVDQAIGRVNRLGQERIVFVYEYRLARSFDSMLVERRMYKAIPNLIAQLSREFAPTSNENGEVDIGRLVIRNHALHELAPGESAQRGDKTDSHHIIQKLLYLMEGTMT